MIKHVGHGGIIRRIAINVGAGYLPGINTIITGASQAAGQLGWEIVGIRDGFEGLLHPDRYPDGGLVTLSPEMVALHDLSQGGTLGQAPRVDPFHDTTLNNAGVDYSDEILKKLKEENIDALISVVGNQGLDILYRLHRKGLHTVCIPKSIENDIPVTSVSFGFNSALSFTIEMLQRARQAAISARKIAVVEVIGEQAGWLSLQAGIAISADAVLLPEIPCNLNMLARRLDEKISSRRPYGLVIVAEGVKLFKKSPEEKSGSSRIVSLPPEATGEASEQVIVPFEKTAEILARELQLLIERETYPLVVGPWARGGSPTAVDLQLGMAYGAGAIQALKASKNGVMVAFAPPEIQYVPLAEVINKVRTVTAGSEFLKIAGSLGIYVGNFSSKKTLQSEEVKL
jgi:6-phosphofructokinase 1